MGIDYGHWAMSMFGESWRILYDTDNYSSIPVVKNQRKFIIL